MILKIAIIDGNVQAFKYQWTGCEEEEVEVNPEFINEPIFTESQQYRFKVENGTVVKKTDEELKQEPRWIEYQKENRTKAYKEESDPMYFKASRGEIEMQVWLDKISEIKNRYPY